MNKSEEREDKKRKRVGEGASNVDRYIGRCIER